MSDNNENESLENTLQINHDPLVISMPDATEIQPGSTEPLLISSPDTVSIVETDANAPLDEQYSNQQGITIEPIIEDSLNTQPLVIEDSLNTQPLVIEDRSDIQPLTIEPVLPEVEVTEPILSVVPKLIFIVPYRDRAQQQQFFSAHMNVILEDIPKQDYEIYYIHQADAREFNRGAMKNIGFLAMKNKYPNDYQNITFVFNDVDTMPFSKNFLNYETSAGVVKHFYGYTFALGGIVSVNGSDFEKTLGYPNFWTWGYEDNLLQKRILSAGIEIDRSQFYPIMDKNIFQMKDGITRIVNRGEFERFVADTTEGWQSITGLQYSIDDSTKFINVTAFDTGFQEKKELTRVHDLRNGSRPFQSANLMAMNSGRGRAKPKMSMRL